MNIKKILIIVSVFFLNACAMSLEDICNTEAKHNEEVINNLNSDDAIQHAYGGKIVKLSPFVYGEFPDFITSKNNLKILRCPMKADFSNKREAQIFVIYAPTLQNYDFNTQNNDRLTIYATNKEIEKSRDLLKKQKEELLKKQEEDKRLERKRENLKQFNHLYPLNKYPLKIKIDCQTVFGQQTPIGFCLYYGNSFIDIEDGKNQFTITFPGYVNGMPLENDRYFPLTKYFSLEALHFSKHGLLSIKLFDRTNNKLIKNYTLVPGKRLILRY